LGNYRTIPKLTIRAVARDDKPVPVVRGGRLVAATVKADAGPKLNLGNLNKAQLVATAEARGLDTSGTKADLIGRLSDG